MRTHAEWRVLIHMPSAFAYPLQGHTYNWAYETEPEPHMEGRRVPCPRGRVIGGSSSINGMVYIRGHRSDYDGWAAQTGDDAWSWRKVLPDFCAHEHSFRGDGEFHAAGGEWHTTCNYILPT